MQLSEPEIYLLITRHLSFNTTIAEDEWLAAWLMASKDNRQLFEEVKAVWLSAGRQHNGAAETGKAFASLKSRLQQEEREFLQGPVPAPLRRTKSTRIFKIAGFSLAGAAVAASLLWMFIARPEITPGSREKTIVAAEKTTLTLSDGSMVCLSPGSRLSYPEVFDEQHRTVRLDGQAFFKVSKRPHQPFTVVSGTLLTEVLGTAFTIAAFPDRDKITVALVEGRVNVRGGHGQQHMLQPGMELVLDKNKEQVQVRPIGINDNITGWMSRELVFNDITLSEAAEQLQAVYGVHLVFENQRAANCRIWGKFSDRPLPEVLETIKLAGVAYQLKGKDSIYISAKK